jgi:deoxyribonuclease V
MILAFDTYYFDNKAKTVCIVFEYWTDQEIYKVYAEVLETTQGYIPGEFYRRELPCIMSLLQRIGEKDIEALVIDGFVYLDDHGKLGLGGHLYGQLGGAIPVIGVAKTDFVTNKKNRREVWRGKSKRPLYVSAMGVDVDQAAENIKCMAGNFRMPTLLKKLDRLTKQYESGNCRGGIKMLMKKPASPFSCSF